MKSTILQGIIMGVYLREKYVGMVELLVFLEDLLMKRSAIVMSFGDNLERIRKDKKVSQAKLGAALGLTQQMVSSYEKGIYHRS